MKRTTVILVFLLAMGAVASAQYAYSSTSLSQTSGTIYASTYVEVDYLTADYYSVATWNELDQDCSLDSCEYPTNTVAAAWSYGASSTSWSSSASATYGEYSLYAAPEVVTYYYYYNEYYQPVYEDEYGYSYAGGEDCTPDFYEYAPDSYVEIDYDIIPLDLAYAAAVTCDFTISPASAHATGCTTGIMTTQIFGANVTPSANECPWSVRTSTCSISVNPGGSLDPADGGLYECAITAIYPNANAYFFGPDNPSSNSSLNVSFTLVMLGQSVTHTSSVPIICP
jgi:hypothetical protein